MRSGSNLVTTSLSSTIRKTIASGKRPDWARNWHSSIVRGKPSRINPVDLEKMFCLQQKSNIQIYYEVLSFGLVVYLVLIPIWSFFVPLSITAVFFTLKNHAKNMFMQIVHYSICIFICIYDYISVLTCKLKPSLKSSLQAKVTAAIRSQHNMKNIIDNKVLIKIL